MDKGYLITYSENYLRDEYEVRDEHGILLSEEAAAALSDELNDKADESRRQELTDHYELVPKWYDAVKVLSEAGLLAFLPDKPELSPRNTGRFGYIEVAVNPKE